MSVNSLVWIFLFAASLSSAQDFDVAVGAVKHRAKFGDSSTLVRPAGVIFHEQTDSIFYLFNVKDASWTLAMADATPGLLGADRVFNLGALSAGNEHTILLKVQAKSFRVLGVLAFSSNDIRMDGHFALEESGSLILTLHCATVLTSESVPSTTLNMAAPCPAAAGGLAVGGYVVRVNSRTMVVEQYFHVTETGGVGGPSFALRGIAAVGGGRVAVVGSGSGTVDVLDGAAAVYTRSEANAVVWPLMFVLGDSGGVLSVVDVASTPALIFAGTSLFGDVVGDGVEGAWVSGVVTTGAASATVPSAGGPLTLAYGGTDAGLGMAFVLRFQREAGVWSVVGGQGMRLTVPDPFISDLTIESDEREGAYLLSSTDQVVGSSDPCPAVGSMAHVFIGSTHGPNDAPGYVAHFRPAGALDWFAPLIMPVLQEPVFKRIRGTRDGMGGLWIAAHGASTMAASSFRPPPYNNTPVFITANTEAAFVMHLRYDGYLRHYEYLAGVAPAGFVVYAQRQEVVIVLGMSPGVGVYTVQPRAGAVSSAVRVSTRQAPRGRALTAEEIDEEMALAAPPCVEPLCVRSWVLGSSTFPSAKGWSCTYVPNQKRGPYVMTECVEGESGDGVSLRGAGSFANGGAGNGIDGVPGDVVGLTVDYTNTSRFVFFYEKSGSMYVGFAAVGSVDSEKKGLFLVESWGPLTSPTAGATWADFQNGVWLNYVAEEPALLWFFVAGWVKGGVGVVVKSSLEIHVATVDTSNPLVVQGQAWDIIDAEWHPTLRRTAIIHVKAAHGLYVPLFAVRNTIQNKLDFWEAYSAPKAVQGMLPFRVPAIEPSSSVKVVFSRVWYDRAYIAYFDSAGTTNAVMLGVLDFRSHSSPLWTPILPHPRWVWHSVPQLSVLQLGRANTGTELLVVPGAYGVEVYQCLADRVVAYSGVISEPSAFLNASLPHSPPIAYFRNPIYVHCESAVHCMVVFGNSDGATPIGDGAVMNFVRRGGTKVWQVSGALAYTTTTSPSGISLGVTSLAPAVGVKQGLRPPSPAQASALAFNRPQVVAAGAFVVLHTKTQWWIFGPRA